jgi:FixJ family two-component response regulator
MTEAEGMVFVVDDDPAMRRSLGSPLRSGGLCVEVFAWAQDLLRSIPPNLPGSLVLDVRLPGLSALDLQRPMRVRAMKDGAVEFLTKPFRDEELLVTKSQGRRDGAFRIHV